MSQTALPIDLLFAHLLKTLPNPVVITERSGRITHLNPACERLAGCRVDDAIGRPLWEVVATPENHDLARTFYTTLDSTDFPIEATVTSHTRSGETRTILWRSEVMRAEDGAIQYVLSTGTDVTRESILAEELSRSRTHEDQLLGYYDLLESLRDPVIIRGPDNRIQYWNPMAVRLYGWSSEDATGQNIHELLRTRHPIALPAVEQALARDGQWNGELVQTTRDGSEVIVESRQVLRRDASGSAGSILELNRDVTALRQAELQRERLVEELALQRTRFETVLQQLPVGVVLVELTSFRILLANRRVESLVARELHEGLPISALLDLCLLPDGTPLRSNASRIMAILRGELDAHGQEMQIPQPDGRKFPAWATISTIRNRMNEPLYGVVTIDDAMEQWERSVGAIAADDADVRAGDPISPDVFIRLVGRRLAESGRVPLEGRLVALLLLSPRTVSLSSAATALHVTKGALSKVVGELHARGDLEITRALPSREHYLALTNRMYLRDLLDAREQSAQLASLAFAVLRSPSIDTDEVRQQLREFANVRARDALYLSSFLETRLKAQARARATHLAENWDAVAPRNDGDPN